MESIFDAIPLIIMGGIFSLSGLFILLIGTLLLYSNTTLLGISSLSLVMGGLALIFLGGLKPIKLTNGDES